MPLKEASSRIKINKLLEDSGWWFFDNEQGKANIVLENHTKISKQQNDALGEDFEHLSNGFIDYLLLDDKGFPLIVLEAKREGLHPLVGKEQARNYAQSQKVRYILLSNGNLHYFWDLDRGNPETITSFPTPESLTFHSAYVPDKNRLINEQVGKDYIVQTQFPACKDDPLYQDPLHQDEFLVKHKLVMLRKYQMNAIKAIQKDVNLGKERFLFEMATGTGKTLTAAAIIKLFLRTGNARRVLFLVDRLELESQAYKNFVKYLKNDYLTLIYKENRNDWRKAEIVVTTIQSLLSNNKYKTKFSPTDFDLVISDEAHRSIGGNSRAVFEYFIGYKLGLTATPKDYLKKITNHELRITNEGTSFADQHISTLAHQVDPREFERRILLDTYKTFGCESGLPTFRYSLLDGVKEGFLVNPVVVDARTEITTQLLSDDGYSVLMFRENEEEMEGVSEEMIFKQRHFERKFFSEETNQVFCKTFLENALHDPVSGEIGKSIVFCVSQHHALKITQILNRMAEKLFSGKYQSDFAVQVTSQISGSQQMTVNFVNNNLNGETRWLEGYKSSRSRVCVTVGMMTTGYDCEDLLNIVLMRPIFSPTDFIQIKGRGTRKFTFRHASRITRHETEDLIAEKQRFKLFDFFANCEFFEEKFDYDEVIPLPRPLPRKGGVDDRGEGGVTASYENPDADPLLTMHETAIGLEGMKIDRMAFQFRENLQNDAVVTKQIADGTIDESLLSYVYDHYINKPEEYFTLEKLRRSLKIDRKISLREALEHLFFGHRLKPKDELLDDEFSKFISIYKPENDDVVALRYFFKAYISDPQVRKIIDSRDYGELYHNPTLSVEELMKVDEDMRRLIPDYVKTYISLNTYMN
jgi:type I restriction enzyme R subunit